MFPVMFVLHRLVGIESVRSKVLSIESSFERNERLVRSKQRFR